MKGSPVPVCITSVARSLPIAWQQRVPVVAPCHSCRVGNPKLPPSGTP